MSTANRKRADAQNSRSKTPRPKSLACEKPRIAVVQPEPVPAGMPEDWKHALRISVLLGLITLVLYAPALKHPFVNYDDNWYIVGNQHVNTGLSWNNVKWAATSIELGNWHPVTWISHQLDCQVFGLNAGGHHLTSVLLHVLNVVLLFLLLFGATRTISLSFLAAALFALHPLNVQSVAWVSERKNLLCTLFFLLGLAAYGWYARRPSVVRYLAVSLFFVLGLASKPMVVTFPLVLLLLDFWPLGRIKGWTAPSSVLPVTQRPILALILEKVPLLALSGASSVITVIAQQGAAAIPASSAWSLSWRLRNALYSYAMYLWQAIFPRGLAPFYPLIFLSHWKVVVAAIILLILAWLAWRWRSSRPYLIAGYLWFLGTLVPAIGVIQVGAQSRADRYTYIPLIGVFVAVVWLCSELAGLQAVKVGWRVAVPAIVLGGLSIVSWQQLGYWRSSIDLWTHALRVTQDNIIAEENLGAVLSDLGREDEAMKHYAIAVAINPSEPNALLNLGTSLMRHGRLQEARQKFEAVIGATTYPRWLATAYRGLGAVNNLEGERAKARENLLHALQYDPDNAADIYNLSLIEAEEGAEKLSAAVAAHPTADGYVQLGRMLEAAHKPDEAEEAYQKALKLDPQLAEAQQALQGLRSPDSSSAQ